MVVVFGFYFVCLGVVVLFDGDRVWENGGCVRTRVFIQVFHGE